MSLRAMAYKVTDSILEQLSRLILGTPREDKELLRFYRLAYIVANGAEVVPKMHFDEGKGIYKVGSIYFDTEHAFYGRKLKRMTKRLIKRRFEHSNLLFTLDRETFDFLYETLSRKEQTIFDSNMEHSPGKYKEIAKHGT